MAVALPRLAQSPIKIFHNNPNSSMLNLMSYGEDFMSIANQRELVRRENLAWVMHMLGSGSILGSEC